MAGVKSKQDLRNRVATFNKGVSSRAYIQQIILGKEAYIFDMNAEEKLFEKSINSFDVSSFADWMFNRIGNT